MFIFFTATIATKGRSKNMGENKATSFAGREESVPGILLGIRIVFCCIATEAFQGRDKA